MGLLRIFPSRSLRPDAKNLQRQLEPDVTWPLLRLWTGTPDSFIGSRSACSGFSEDAEDAVQETFLKLYRHDAWLAMDDKKPSSRDLSGAPGWTG